MVFGRIAVYSRNPVRCVSLNALTGIDGFWTSSLRTSSTLCKGGLNALTGIDGFWTLPMVNRL